MGVVAVGAGDSLGANLVVHPLGLPPLLMAGPAEIFTGNLEELRVLGVVGQMALQARADRRRTMGISPLDEVGMAYGTQLLLLRHDEAGFGALVMAVVAPLFGIGEMDGAAAP